MLPLLTFYRTLPAPDENTEVKVPSMVKGNDIYLNLSDDPLNYQQDTLHLFHLTKETLYNMYQSGSLPTSTNELFVQSLLPEQWYEQSIDLPVTTLPPMQSPSLPPNPNESYTDYVLDLSFDPNFDFVHSMIGSKFILSLKNFLGADDIIVFNESNIYKFFPVDQNENSIRSKINIQELYGYLFMTSSPYGLLALQKLYDMDQMKTILDEYTGKLGFFLPIIMNGDVTTPIDLEKLQHNFEESYDVYENPSDQLKNKVERIGLSTQSLVIKVDEVHTFEYLFVEKHAVYTQLSFLRSMDTPDLFVFLEEQEGEVIQKGPYGTYYCKLSF
jgi:hypothetical protein